MAETKEAGMVERIAKALCDLAYGDHEGWESWIPEARTAIDVMREATPAMLSRGGYHCITGAGAVSKGDIAQAKAVWTAMIDVALQEPTHAP